VGKHSVSTKPSGLTALTCTTSSGSFQSAAGVSCYETGTRGAPSWGTRRLSVIITDVMVTDVMLDRGHRVTVSSDCINAIDKSVGDRQEDALARLSEGVVLGLFRFTWRGFWWEVLSIEEKHTMSTSVTSADIALCGNGVIE